MARDVFRDNTFQRADVFMQTGSLGDIQLFPHIPRQVLVFHNVDIGFWVKE